MHHLVYFSFHHLIYLIYLEAMLCNLNNSLSLRLCGVTLVTTVYRLYCPLGFTFIIASYGHYDVKSFDVLGELPLSNCFGTDSCSLWLFYMLSFRLYWVSWRSLVIFWHSQVWYCIPPPECYVHRIFITMNVNSPALLSTSWRRRVPS